MARQPRYEDTVTYDADLEEVETCEGIDPKSGRPLSEVAAFMRAKAMAELAQIKLARAA